MIYAAAMNLRDFLTITSMLMLLTGCATHTRPEAKAPKSSAEVATRLYFEGFRDGDFTKLKAAVTERLLYEVGEANWKSNLHDYRAKYRTARFNLIRQELHKNSGVAGIRFGLEAGDETVWLVLKRQNGGVWKVDDILGDYDGEGQ
jgi:hypothetical protein